MIEVDASTIVFVIPVGKKRVERMQIDKRHIYFAGGVIAGLVLIAIAGHWAYNKFDVATKLHLSKLKPSVKKKVQLLLLKAQKAGIDLRIVQSHRDCQRQNELYAQGRTSPGNVVTNAKCGQSAHNYQLAVDVVEYKNGKPWWNSTNWEQIGRIGESVGLEWGGRWTSFKDKPHFQDLGGRSISSRFQEFQQTGSF
jgi:peptidoglycan L-alanyl-D-glutamate endopeptidase CwlK